MPLEEEQMPNHGDEEQMPNHGDEVGYDQEEELIPLHTQEPEWVEEKQWNLYDEEDYYGTEEILSPFDLY